LFIEPRESVSSAPVAEKQLAYMESHKGGVVYVAEGIFASTDDKNIRARSAEVKLLVLIRGESTLFYSRMINYLLI
jgi:hypothetical protein